MFLSKATAKFTENCSRLNAEIDNADCIIVGAGAGLSAAAGFTYSGERFEKYFADFIEKYGFKDMYLGGFYPFETLEEHWAYWSRYIYINRYSDTENGVYKRLFELVSHKDYFVLTTNVDHQFQRAGFDKERLFYTQGDYGLFQCPKPCCNKTYDNEEAIRRMYAEQKNMRIPSEFIPYCPVCGKPMTMNLRCDDSFVQDEGWYNAAKRYDEFIHCHKNKHILFLELGVGFNTPGIIKYPFWKMAAENPNAFYACVNLGETFCPDMLKNRSVCIDGDIANVLDAL
ncbi:MAG: Sir2 silent information regulator family NAD-dependent deacetylase [Oscillospiraceae bacterium]|nr:Sir2 silent information regulator family NAD-dependent deacetylase [Oscillospiraceae bacterium]